MFGLREPVTCTCLCMGVTFDWIIHSVKINASPFIRYNVLLLPFFIVIRTATVIYIINIYCSMFVLVLLVIYCIVCDLS